MKTTKGEKIFYVINAAFLCILTLLMIYPIVYVISASFSSSDAVNAGRVLLLPKECSLSAYKYVFAEKQIWLSYGNSIYYTLVGTAVSMAVTICGAYPLSKRVLPGKTLITFLVAFTMWFGAGLIPGYLNMRQLGLLDTRAALILGGACNAFNFILLRNFFMSIPPSLEEAADIDGASQMQILCRIYLPLSLPSLATVALFYAVGKWNDYFTPMVYLNKDSLIPLQVVIKKLIVDLQVSVDKNNSVDQMFESISEQTVVYASIVVSAVPMLIIYPFIQKFFIQGVMVGAIKE